MKDTLGGGGFRAKERGAHMWPVGGSTQEKPGTTGGGFFPGGGARIQSRSSPGIPNPCVLTEIQSATYPAKEKLAKTGQSPFCEGGDKLPKGGISPGEAPGFNLGQALESQTPAC